MGCPIHGHPAMACEHCEAVYARAFTNAQAAGYAEAVADVVAWLRRKSVHGDVLDRVITGIEDCAHVGEAKKGDT